MFKRAVIAGWNITNSRGNGAAGYFRGLCHALALQGVPTTFLQLSTPAHSDLPARQAYSVIAYQQGDEITHLLADVDADTLILKFLDRAPHEMNIITSLLCTGGQVWLADGDAPDTLAHLQRQKNDGYSQLITCCAGVLLLAGGPTAAEQYRNLGAKTTRLWYAAADLAVPQHARNEPPTYDALFVGNRDPGRDQRVEEILIEMARQRPQYTVLLVGDGWDSYQRLPNVLLAGHRIPEELPALYRSARTVINLTRASQREWGYCPSSRLFEAAAAGAMVISDLWPGIATCFTPDRELLIAETADELAFLLDTISPTQRQQYGCAMQARLRRQHTWAHRIAELQQIVSHNAR
jgi:spore maturation protein CgeB